MKFGLVLPFAGRVAQGGHAAIRDVAQAAEAMGFASVWVGDHIVMPDRRIPYSWGAEVPKEDEGNASAYPFPPDQPFLEAFTTLAYVAGLTREIGIGVAVCATPYRRPLILTKVVNTLDFLSGGRLILGIGSGWLPEEFAALGLPFEKRNTITDEVIEFLKTAWRDGDHPVTFVGSHINVKDVHIRPRPIRGAVPLWMGGRGQATRMRTAKYGDGWLAMTWKSDPDWLRTKFKEISQNCRDFGRSPDQLGLGLTVLLKLTEQGAGLPPWQSGYVEGPPSVVASVLRDYAAAGVEYFVFSIGGSIHNRIRGMEIIMREIAPQLENA